MASLRLNRYLVIKLEKIVDNYSLGYPTLLDGKESAPSEDVGGVFSFYEFLEEYHNSKSPEHISTRNWAEGMDFREYDKDLINGRLKKIKYKK